MSDEPNADAVRAWVRLMRTSAGLLQEIEAALKSAGLPALSWYDVLWELEQAGADGLRPADLQSRLLLPQYGLSRLLDRIEGAGHLRRRPLPEDGRGQVVHLTASGRALRRRMWRVYGPAIAGSVGRRLTAREARDLNRLLAKLEAGHG